MLRAIGFCEYGPDEIGDIFPEHAREDINTWSACVPGTSCEQCVGEDIDELIRQSYDQYLDSRGCPVDHRAILAYERGCVAPEIDANGEAECCYSAAMVGECEAGDVPGR
ncbi:hypothetical protein [Paraliomyxa miuraensis]|uniref:hypothetical protein n=1 Tax=Paraliomyxa miuraensis TaxID=376150 RepID=UPI0022574A21|nr:hypothetical protein [Paraliomyxa miuraensis]MCX4245154.1 hypothetical protein [Paraliomyxa miuraensis]